MELVPNEGGTRASPLRKEVLFLGLELKKKIFTMKKFYRLHPVAPEARLPPGPEWGYERLQGVGVSRLRQ